MRFVRCSCRRSVILSVLTGILGLGVTTTILVAGFAILMLSAFDLNKSLGVLTAITLVCALAADFLLLPVILILIDKDKKPQSETDDVDEKKSTDAYQPAQ